MGKYLVRIGSNVFETVEVEADTEDEAEEIALNQSHIEDPIMEGITKLQNKTNDGGSDGASE